MEISAYPLCKMGVSKVRPEGHIQLLLTRQLLSIFGAKPPPPATNDLIIANFTCVCPQEVCSGVICQHLLYSKLRVTCPAHSPTPSLPTCLTHSSSFQLCLLFCYQRDRIMATLFQWMGDSRVDWPSLHKPAQSVSSQMVQCTLANPSSRF